MVKTKEPTLGLRNARQWDILPDQWLQDTTVGIIGVGAVGRQVALILAAMGVKHITLWDHDTVDEANLGVQGFRPDQLGQLKVSACLDDMTRIYPEIEVTAIPTRYEVTKPLQAVTFCCVDSISARRSIFVHAFKSKDCSPEAVLWLDSRLAAEQYDILSCYKRDSESIAAYEKSLFPQEEAAKVRCTAKTTLYCASMCAATLVAYFSQHLRYMPLQSVLHCNILALSMTYD